MMAVLFILVYLDSVVCSWVIAGATGMLRKDKEYRIMTFSEAPGTEVYGDTFGKVFCLIVGVLLAVECTAIYSLVGARELATMCYCALVLVVVQVVRMYNSFGRYNRLYVRAERLRERANELLEKCSLSEESAKELKCFYSDFYKNLTKDIGMECKTSGDFEGAIRKDYNGIKNSIKGYEEYILFFN